MMLILILVCFSKASASEVIGSGSTTALFGGDAYYRCSLAGQTGVLQVTWQRLYKNESLENLATYSERFGPEVNARFIGKVSFMDESLSSTAITLRNVTWGDESCYICSFNAYPAGSKRQQTCLTVQGISKVNTSRTRLDSPQGESKHEFNCSATGKPAPTIEWDFSDATVSHQMPTSKVPNADNTFTSSSSITLSGPAGWSGHVDCVLNKGTKSERRESMYFSEQQQQPEKDKNVNSQLPLVITAVIFIPCIVAAAIVIHKRLKRKAANRDIA